MTHSILPPGLIDNNIEFFVADNKAMALYGGKKVFYNELPEWAQQKIHNALISDVVAFQRLKMRCNTNDIDVLEQEFVKCRFGSFNNTPDLTPEGELQYDSPCCSKIATCKDFGIVCCVPDKLTRKEFIVIKCVSAGMQDHEMARELNNTFATIRTHMQRIFLKLSINNRAELLKYAYSNNIK